MKRLLLILGCLACMNIKTLSTGEVGVLNTVLFWSAVGKSNYPIPYLCDRGAQVNCVNADGATPLHCAARTLQMGRALQLIQAGADGARTDYNNHTPFEVIPPDQAGLEKYHLMRVLLFPAHSGKTRE